MISPVLFDPEYTGVAPVRVNARPEFRSGLVFVRAGLEVEQPRKCGALWSDFSPS